MIFAARAGALRWLRLALAWLALVASQASVARAAFGTTCPRGAAPGVVAVVAGAAESAVLRAGALETAALEAPHDARHDGPAQPAGAPPCATGVAALPQGIRVPHAVTAWDAAASPLALQTRPLSLAPPPPFRPPRAI